MIAFCGPMPMPGLSPYTRGNHCAFLQNPLIFWHAVWCRLSGRVVACLCRRRVARFDSRHRTAFQFTRVYPRTHGETGMFFPTSVSLAGLSPYTRGNHTKTPYPVVLTRSIPVHTGKPVCMVQLSIRDGVYPRTHGETRHSQAFKMHIKGLSPYTRGNHSEVKETLDSKGSIPVHTGKPRK